MRRVTPRRIRRSAIVALLLALLASAGQARAGGEAARAAAAAAPSLTPDQEAQLGDAIADRIARSGALTTDPVIDAVLRDVAASFEGVTSPWGWHLHVLKTPGVTSFDTLGGHLYVSRGLILACADATELRAALAHQMAHAIARDTLHAMLAGYGPDRVLALARGETPNVLDGIAANLAASGTLARHGDATEAAADAATPWLGGSPAALGALLARLSSRKQGRAPWAEASPWHALTARYLDIHPVTRKRLRALAESAEAAHSQAPSPSPSSDGFEHLRDLALAP